MPILAALMFFTRLPLWRWVEVPPQHFKNVVAYWPLVGWLTGALAAGVLWVAGLYFPPTAAVVLALAARMLLSGGLHEDGLADFFDGFGGGGTDRTRILAIMKDSYIGSYGVLALIVYVALWVSLLAALPRPLAIVALLCADPLAKGCAAQLINLLPYARTAEQSKAKIVYQRMTPRQWIIAVGAALAPTLLLMPIEYWWCVVPGGVLLGGLVRMMKQRLGGYTGDCCGATCLLCELTFLAALTIGISCV